MRRSEATPCATPIRWVFRPQAQGASSTHSFSSGNAGDSICSPSWASHSAASRLPDFPITCSNTGTRNAAHRVSRSASLNRGSPALHKTITECVKEGMPLRANSFNCSNVAATAAGANAAAWRRQHPRARSERDSTCHPSGLQRTLGALVSARKAPGLRPVPLLVRGVLVSGRR